VIYKFSTVSEKCEKRGKSMGVEGLHPEQIVLMQFLDKDKFGIPEIQKEQFSSMEEAAKFAMSKFIGSIMDKIELARIRKRNLEEEEQPIFILEMYDKELKTAKQELEETITYFREMITDCYEFLREEEN